MQGGAEVSEKKQIVNVTCAVWRDDNVPLLLSCTASKNSLHELVYTAGRPWVRFARACTEA